MSNKDTKELTKAEKERAVNKVVSADIEGSQGMVWSGSTVNLIKAKYPDLDLTDIRLYGRICVARGIDPTSGDLIPIVFGKGKARGGKGGRTLVLIETIDSLRKRGWATGLVAQIKGPEWCGPDGVWKDVWLEEEAPMAARFGVRRKDVDEIHWSVRLMKEVRKTGTGADFWNDGGESGQPVNMIGIAAERHGWRKNVPNLFASIYREDLVGPVSGEADVERLPEYVDADLLGPVVADADGVIEAEPSPQPAERPKPGQDGGHIVAVLELLKPRMKDSQPPYGSSDLESLAGWPQGAGPEKGLATLLEGDEGSPDEQATTLMLMLTNQRMNGGEEPFAADNMFDV